MIVEIARTHGGRGAVPRKIWRRFHRHISNIKFVPHATDQEIYRIKETAPAPPPGPRDSNAKWMWHVARKRHLLTYYTIIITIHIIAMYKAVSVYWIFVGLLSVTWFLMYFISQFLLRWSRKNVEILYITFFRISFYFYIRALKLESLCLSLCGGLNLAVLSCILLIPDLQRCILFYP